MQATTIDLKSMQEKQDTASRILSEEEKQILAAKADRQFFAVLYQNYYEQIMRFVYQRVHTKDEAFDVTQQVFLQAMTALDKYEFRGLPFSSWLYRIALNELNQRFRKNKNQRTVNVDDTSLASVLSEIEENTIEEKEAQLLHALQTLEEDDMQLLEMRYFEKRAFKEIGEIMNITENNAKVRMYRVLERLKKAITPKKN